MPGPVFGRPCLMGGTVSGPVGLGAAMAAMAVVGMDGRGFARGFALGLGPRVMGRAFAPMGSHRLPMPGTRLGGAVTNAMLGTEFGTMGRSAMAGPSGSQGIDALLMGRGVTQGRHGVGVRGDFHRIIRIFRRPGRGSGGEGKQGKAQGSPERGGSFHRLPPAMGGWEQGERPGKGARSP